MIKDQSKTRKFRISLQNFFQRGLSGLIKDRPIQLLLAVTLSAAIFVGLDAATGWHVWDRLFYPTQDTPADVQAWSALIYAVALVLGLPVAFLLWHWRDRNVRDQIDNARKDINLKEFQEVQLRAAGALDDKLPEMAREQLQIAALHQLRGFLRGDYGESFRRPAFELLLSGHGVAMDRIGVPEVRKQINEPNKVWPLSEIMQEIANLRLRLTRVDLERLNIIRDEKKIIFESGFPLEARSFDLLDLSGLKLPEHCSLDGSSFVGAFLRLVEFNAASLRRVHFEGAQMGKARLKYTNLAGAHFEGAYLNRSRMENAGFWETHFESADLKEAYFENARLHNCYFEGANLGRVGTHGLSTCFGCRYNDLTVFARSGDFDNLPNSKTADEIRSHWRELGALHVDELE